MKFKSVCLGDICDITSSKRIFAKDYVSNGIPFYRGKEIIEKHNLQKVSQPLFISVKKFNEIKEKYGTPEIGDVLLTSVGTLGVPWLVDEKDFYFKDGNLTWFHAHKNDLLPRYLYLWLISTDAQNQINSSYIGSTQKALTIESLKKLSINLPSVTDQQAICNIIYPLCNEIKINSQINDNLTQQVNAIYEYMFITNADSSWKTGKLSDIVTVRYGKDHKKIADGIYPVYGSGGIMRYVERPLYDKESVLIPRKGTLNNVIYVNQPFWSVDTMFYTEMRIPNVAKFVYNYVKAKNLSALNSGSAVPSMTTDILNAIELVIPSNSALEKFEEAVSPLYKEMQKNNRQSEILGKLRDILLPRLISGEIVIP